MKMPNLEDPQDEWEVEEVRDKQQIKGVVHYLIKWAGWPSEYNSYELVSHLTNTLKAVADFECKLKRKQKETQSSTHNNMDNEVVAPKNIPGLHKRAWCLCIYQ